MIRVVVHTFLARHETRHLRRCVFRLSFRISVRLYEYVTAPYFLNLLKNGSLRLDKFQNLHLNTVGKWSSSQLEVKGFKIVFRVRPLSLKPFKILS